MKVLDYEKKIWGTQTASLSVFNGYCWTLKYGLEATAGVQGRILDLGCGAGAFTAALKYYRPDLEVVGMDLSKRGIKIAKKRQQPIKFIQGDIERLPFEDESFAALLANHLLEHLDKPEISLTEIYRVLKPKGVFYSSTPLEGNWSSLIRWLRAIPRFKRDRLKYLGHKQAFSQKEYLSLLKKAGFRVEKINWSGFLIYQIIDVLYYPLLAMLGKKPEYLAEVEMLKSDRRIYSLGYYLGKGLINLVSNLENLFLGRLPGFIIHVKALK